MRACLECFVLLLSATAGVHGLPCKVPAEGYQTECVSEGCSCTCSPGYDNQGGMFPVCKICEPGKYKAWPGPFRCEPCQDAARMCPTNAYLTGCGFDTAGSCKLCNDCPAGQWMKLCNGEGNSGRLCAMCDQNMCAPDEALVDCGGTSRGHCQRCAACRDGYYMSACTPHGPLCAPCNPHICLLGQYLSDCGGTSQGVCLPCQGADRCSPGQVVKDCSPGNPGFCTDCPEAFFRSELSGACESCNATVCAKGEFLDGCRGSSAGTCQQCQPCPPSQYLTECSKDFTTCEFCNAYGRTRFDEFLLGCGNTSAGTVEKCPRCPEAQYLVGCKQEGSPICRDCSAELCSSSEYLLGCQGTYCSDRPRNRLGSMTA